MKFFIFKYIYICLYVYLTYGNLKGDTEISMPRPSVSTFRLNFHLHEPVDYTEEDFLAFKKIGEKGVAYCKHSDRPYDLYLTCNSIDFTYTCDGETNGRYEYNCR